MILQVLTGLAYLHRMGVVHGDVRPATILIDPKLGLVKLNRVSSMQLVKKSPKLLVTDGNLNYSSPEVLSGAARVTCATDVWSVGCTLAEMFMQKVLFPGEDLADQLDCITDILGSLSPSAYQSFCAEVGCSPAKPVLADQRRATKNNICSVRPALDECMYHLGFRPCISVYGSLSACSPVSFLAC
eukprot:m.344885 g.344885  ORF g.344885 m.344885 type:complete len:186 (-) comp55803_c0_seq2:834-1391(-)